MKAFFHAVGAFVPKKHVSNEELSREVDTSDDWIYSHTGIKYRYIADENTTASDLAINASLNALARTDLSPEKLDLIIVATSTPDYIGYPSTACIVQDKIGAVNAGAFDISAACTGFIYGVEIARNFIESKTMKNILVIGSEINSKILDWKDRNTCVLFGDGAGAAIISARRENSDSEIILSSLKSEGSGADSLLIPAGGSKEPFRLDKTEYKDLFIQMDGRRVYNFAVRALCDTILYLLNAKNLSIEDISHIVPHQANDRIINAAAKRLKIQKDKFFLNIENYANTSAASIPIALCEMDQKNLLKRGDYILTIGFGGGLTYGGNLIRW